jgi:peptide/nickel transport system permease protein
MSFYILRRILYAIPIAFGVSVVCFSLVYIAPGDPLQTVLPPDATAETIAIVKKAYGFDKPVPVQYLQVSPFWASACAPLCRIGG